MKPKPSEAHDADGIPDEMKAERRWVAWRAEQRDGRWTKIPMSPSGGNAKSNDPATWGTYDEAAKVGRGVGFMLGDGWLGVDLDGVLEAGRTPDEWIRDWIDSAGTFVEISPSGTGYHAIFRGVARTPGTANRKGNVEVYDATRFFCITGRRATRTPLGIGSSQAAVDALSRRFLTEDAPRAVEPLEASGGDYSVQDWRLCADLARRGFSAEEIAEQLRAKMKADGRSVKEQRSDYVAMTVRKAYERYRPPPAHPLEILSLRDVLGKWPERKPYVVENFCREGEVAAIIAPSKSRKSWVVADLAVCVASGLMWLDKFPCREGRVLMVDNELQPGDLAQRINSICQGRGFSPLDIAERIDVVTLRESEMELPDIMEQLNGTDYVLTIWDALYMMFLDKMQENSNSDMSRLLRMFRRFATRTNAATLFVHHTAKGESGGKKSIDLGAGAGVIGRAPDVHMTMVADEEHEDRYAVRCSMRSSARPMPFAVEWNHRLWRYEAAFVDPLEILEPKSKRSSKKQGQGD